MSLPHRVPNDRPKLESTKVHPEEPMNVLGSLTKSEQEVTDRTADDPTAGSLAGLLLVDDGFPIAHRRSLPILVFLSLCAPGPSKTAKSYATRVDFHTDGGRSGWNFR